MPWYAYPWDGLEEAMQRERDPPFTVVGYGSLLNSYSARRTLSLDQSTLFPVISFGVKRVYNYKTPPEVLRRYGDLADPLAIACLNTQVTYRPQDAINGLTYVLKVEEVEALRRREQGYDLVPVVSIDWHHPREVYVHYVLSAPDALRMGQRWIAPGAKPLLAYDALCKQGALSISEAFLAFFSKTTYLSDGITLI